MQELPDTRESLLLQIRDPENRAAWEAFVEIYRPVVYRFASSRGLQNADALDLVQTVFIAVANSIANWEKQNGHWRIAAGGPDDGQGDRAENGGACRCQAHGSLSRTGR